ncbi:uncharacterized protein [Rutidosis leptorrhynchoides]|uniref:uncharacterized protein isoform X2 n=1 Tax=Rutidosis leptorrhynchoides TaxID=125765 RepID=UPI003A99C849
MMLKTCNLFSRLNYPRWRVIQPCTLMYVAQQGYSMVVSNPSLVTTRFEPRTDDVDSDKPVLKGNNWDSQLLKVTFLESKTLSLEKQRLWLIAHLILRNRRSILEIVSSNSDDEDEENCKIIQNIVCSDKICIDAKHFERESICIQDNYECGCDVIEVESNSEIIKKVEFFCVERAKIQDYYAHDHYLLQHKLDSFNSIFCRDNRIYAIDLMIAATDLEIKCLIDLMMEDVDDIFNQMTSDDEAYKILFVNLRVDYSLRRFECMLKMVLKHCRWAFDDADSHKPGLKAKENINWGLKSLKLPFYKLLKVSFYEYKTLPYEQRRQWLTTHFLLRKRTNADLVGNYLLHTERKSKPTLLEPSEEEVNQLLASI